ncbi:alcohol dehydrogenase [Pleurostoma richardsiae]|uniref:Alcohol dehydrogenase n=1 Tax=Pleurostoma richardsiae TaxID=41990 RepID=A0AA38RGX5_9PEZI|nr:alcohol dehydrogenase [Pleurostoma richardsiae]
MSFEFGTEVCRPAFDDRATPKISYGLRFPEAVARHCQDTFSSSRVYVICSRSLAKTDALQRLTTALGGRLAGVRNGITPHTPIAEVMETVNEVQGRDIDCIVTLGAGSLTDAAKLVRLALANGATTEEDMKSLWGTPSSNPALRKNIVKPSIPLIHIPTSLSGGEYQAIAGGTESAGHAKRTFHCEGVNPELVIQDPELCLTTPQWVWLSTGIRSVDHCVETLCSLLSNPKGDEWAARGLPKLVAGLLDSKANPTSLSARRLCQEGTVEAMCAVSSGVPLGASHAIGHQLGPLGVGHGETSCILLPYVCRYNLAKKANAERQATVRDLLLRQSQVRGLLEARNIDAATVDLGTILYTIIRALEMPQSLEAVGIGRDKLPILARNSLDDIWIRTNAVPITEESQVMEILNMCFSREKSPF